MRHWPRSLSSGRLAPLAAWPAPPAGRGPHAVWLQALGLHAAWPLALGPHAACLPASAQGSFRVSSTEAWGCCSAGPWLSGGCVGAWGGRGAQIAAAVQLLQLLMRAAVLLCMLLAVQTGKHCPGMCSG